MTASRRQADLETVATGVWRLSRVFDRIRTQMITDTEPVADYTSMVLLFALAAGGPMRASALADVVHSDASTVSRQVASLVTRGLVERRADPGDGRATVLVATDQAHALVARKARARDDHFGRVLGDWTSAEVQTFAPLLARLADDLEQHMHELLTDCSAPTPVSRKARP